MPIRRRVKRRFLLVTAVLVFLGILFMSIAVADGFINLFAMAKLAFFR